MASSYSINKVNPVELSVDSSEIHFGTEFVNTILRDCAGKPELIKFKRVFEAYSYMDCFVRAHATPVDNANKLAYNFIEIKDKDGGMVSYVPNGKEKERPGDNAWDLSLRQTMKFGKFFKAFFHPIHMSRFGINDADIEKLSAFVKGKYSRDDFEVVIMSGDQIKWAYYEGNTCTAALHGGEASSSLQKSCMRYEKCKDWFGLYTEDTRIKMAVLKHKPTNTVAARALLWHDINVIYGGSGLAGSNINFMDRVYAVREWMIPFMLDWATNNGYYKKQKQSMDYKTQLYSPENILSDLTLEFVAPKVYPFFPYTDTFSYLQKDRLTFNNTDRKAQWTLTEWQTGNAKVAIPVVTAICCSCCSIRREREDMTDIPNYGYTCQECVSDRFNYSNRHSRFLYNDDSCYVRSIDDWVYSYETQVDGVSGDRILEGDGVEAINNSNRWIWTLKINTIVEYLTRNRYVTGNSKIVMIGERYYHVDNTFTCAFSGEIFPETEDHVFISSKIVAVKNRDEYMIQHGLVFNESFQIVPAPVLVEELVVEITEPIQRGSGRRPTPRRVSATA